MVAWYIISRHYKSRDKKNIGRMAEAEGKSWVFFRMNFAALVRLSRNSLMLSMFLLMVFWHVVSSSDFMVCYTQSARFSSSWVRVMKVRKSTCWFSCSILEITKQTSDVSGYKSWFFVTLSCCDLQSSRFVLCLPGEIFKPVEANETAMQFGLLVN